MAKELHTREVIGEEPAPAEGLTLRAAVLSLVFFVISLIWMRQAGLIALGAQIGESVPVIPAIAAVLLLTSLRPLLRRLPRPFHMSEAQTMLVYSFLVIAVSMPSVGVVRQILPQLTVPFYFAGPENEYAVLQSGIPDWLVPDHAVIQTMYEGTEDGSIPWRGWVVPLAAWSLFLLAMFVTMYALMLIFRRQWIQKEHLTFPIVQLALTMGDAEGKHVVGGFLRNPAMWMGFGLAAIYNVMNMLNAWNPAVPALGKYFQIGSLFTERPWSAMGGLSIAWRPENFGIGYLVSTDILLSVWVFEILFRLSAVASAALGYDISGFPMERQHAWGGYLAFGLVLLWVGRSQLKAALSKAFTGDPSVDDSDEPYPYRVTVWAGIIGFVVMMVFAIRSGMWPLVALWYLGISLLFTIVYARARAEGGAALVWLFPIAQHWEMTFNIFGSKVFHHGNNWANMSALGLFYWVSRGYFGSMSAYQIEGCRIADESGINQRTMIKWMLAALIIGLLGAYIIHLEVYYGFGANILEGGTTQGGSRVRSAARAWDALSGFVRADKLPDTTRTAAGISGFVITMLLMIARTVWLRFPLHPLGFVMVASYATPIWGPFFIVWVVKSLVLRIGGMGTYRRLIPFFLGLVVGHFFTAGVVWGWVGLINDMYRRYGVWFG
ncbi:MAG: hypothetical protein J7M38_05260 [Armatimonadetes bacterium]|nr:hypothetical protein [Armatimonadota bacterium]